MMRIDVIRKSATIALCSGMLVGLLFAAGCSDQPKTGNKLDDPELKAYMQKNTDQFKAKMQEKKTNSPKKGSSKGFVHP
jgi:hypothetical protein